MVSTNKTEKVYKVLVKSTNNYKNYYLYSFFNLFLRVSSIFNLSIIIAFLCRMAHNFSKQLTVDGKNLLAIIVPELRKDGMYYEVNIKGFPRFKMSWSALGRYDIVEPNDAIPYNVLLVVSDIIEAEDKK